MKYILDILDRTYTLNEGQRVAVERARAEGKRITIQGTVYFGEVLEKARIIPEQDIDEVIEQMPTSPPPKRPQQGFMADLAREVIRRSKSGDKQYPISKIQYTRNLLGDDVQRIFEHLDGGN
jgi:hypothetical protein